MSQFYSYTDRFLDENGDPIVNGYIYFGEYGQNPKTSLISIYSNESLNTELANPQRTDAYGRLENTVYIDRDHSFIVENSNEAIIDGAKNIRLLESRVTSPALLGGLTFIEPDFRFDAVAADRGSALIVDGLPVHQIAAGQTLHFGDGWIPIEALTAYNLKITGRMSAAEASKNIAIEASFFDENNTLLRKVTLDNSLAPSNIDDFNIEVIGLILSNDYSNETNGRVQIKLISSSTASHSGALQVKKVEVVRV